MRAGFCRRDFTGRTRRPSHRRRSGPSSRTTSRSAPSYRPTVFLRPRRRIDRARRGRYPDRPAPPAQPPAIDFSFLTAAETAAGGATVGGAGVQRVLQGPPIEPGLARRRAKLEGFALSAAQWAKIVRRSEGGPGCGGGDGGGDGDGSRRLARLDGPAATLMASYRRSWTLHSQFVPLATSTAAEIGSSPPRFFTHRECARLQGFPENFIVDACRSAAFSISPGFSRAAKSGQSFG